MKLPAMADRDSSAPTDEDCRAHAAEAGGMRLIRTTGTDARLASSYRAEGPDDSGARDASHQEADAGSDGTSTR